MTRAEYLAWFEEYCTGMLETTRRKNTDYSGGKDDPFSNFRGYEDCGVTVEQGIMTRLVDKHSRACEIVSGHTPLVTDEALEDTLKDSVIYTMLLLAWRENQRREQAAQEHAEATAPHPHGWVPVACGEPVTIAGGGDGAGQLRAPGGAGR